MKFKIVILTLIIVLFSTSIFAHGKDTLPSEKPKFGIDYYIVPTLFYNSLTLGFNYQPTSKIEHRLTFGAWALKAPYTWLMGSININYNLNVYYKNRKSYLPIWLGVRNTIGGGSVETESYSPHTINIPIGTGFGYKAKLFKKNFLRFEAIGGAALHFTNGNYYPNENVYFFSKLSDYSFEKHDTKYHSKVIPAFRLKLSFVREF